MKPKRTKKVFSNHSQCAHVWAQQTQSSGIAGNVFFAGDTFYSYGYHYKAAQIHTVKGNTFALVNSYPYSPSTNKHLHEVRDALRGLMLYFDSPNVTDPRAAVAYNDALALQSLKTPLKRLKVSSREDLDRVLENIRCEFARANSLRAFLGIAKIKLNTKDRAAVKKHLEARLKRTQEHNTPEMIKARKDKAMARIKVELDKAIQDFRNTGSIKQVLYKLPHELLRVNGDTVVTSRGANVPLVEALSALKALKQCPTATPSIGSFNVESMSQDSDPVVKIGCHRILMSEALNQLNKETN